MAAWPLDHASFHRYIEEWAISIKFYNIFICNKMICHVQMIWMKMAFSHKCWKKTKRTVINIQNATLCTKRSHFYWSNHVGSCYFLILFQRKKLNLLRILFWSIFTIEVIIWFFHCVGSRTQKYSEWYSKRYCVRQHDFAVEIWPFKKQTII